MNISQVANDIAQVWGMPDYANAPQLAKERILIDVNAAIQQLQDAGEDFYGREDLEVTLATGTETYTLPKTVQTVLEDGVRLADGTPLRQLTSRGQLLTFGQIFLNQLTNVVVNSAPTHYYVESLRDTSDITGDDVKTRIHLRPAPDALHAGTAQLIVGVINEPAMVTSAQLSAGTSNLPIPHKYVESIFLPLARYNASGSFLFYDKEKKPQIDSDYERALQLLGKSDPRRPKPADSQPEALVVRAQQPQPAGAAP